jgi:hypothetical protein
MKPSSAKQKGRLLQQYVRDAILKQFPQLEPDDVRSTSMGASGADVQLSPAARHCFNYRVECKSLAAFVGYRFLAQADTGSGTGVPLAVVKGNYKSPIVLVDFDHFMELVKNASNPKV